MEDVKLKHLQQIRCYAQQKLEADTSGHSMDHIERVVQLAIQIAEIEQADSYVVQAAALLHDVIDDKVVSNSLAEKNQLFDFLNQLDDSLSEKVMEIIERMSYKKNLENPQELTLEGKIVQDADRLDAIGAIGIARTFYYNGHLKNKMYDPNLLPRTHLTAEEYRNQPNTAINHFYEKLLLLEQKMNTDYAKKLAKERTEFMNKFLNQFYKEWKGE